MPNNLQAEDKAGTKTRKRRFAEALEIKASALRIIEAKGTLMRVSEIDLLHAEWKGLDIMYAPKMPDDPPEFIEQAQRSGIAVPPITPHLLDILQHPMERCRACRNRAVSTGRMGVAIEPSRGGLIY
jgi:hypothetical protein